MSVLLSPSILASDFVHLADEIARIEEGGADLIHIDVMDGQFVPNITIGLPIVAAIKRIAKVPLDVHLMIVDPDRYLEGFVKAGADRVTVHQEATTHLHRTLGRIRQLGALAGVALNPATPVALLQDVVSELDYVLVMSVNPGFSGQTFIPRTFHKVTETRAMLSRAASTAGIEIDGGVDLGNARDLVTAGASILVAGVSVFGDGDPAAATRALRRAATGAK